MKLRKLGVTLVTSITLFALITLLSQPIYANSCQAYITSSPSDADVYVNDRLIGKSPVLHFVGSPFQADIRVEKEGYQTWTQHINVDFNEHKQVFADLTPLQISPGAQITVTKTVSTTITITSTTTLAQATVTSTTTVAQVTITSSTTVTTSSIMTVTSKVTEQTGLPTEITYGAIGIGVITVIASIVIVLRKK